MEEKILSEKESLELISKMISETKNKLEQELRIAIDESRFIPYFQPQYRVDTNQLCGAESLLRWNHPTRGILSAKEFIHTAEESGLIIQIGNQVLIDVCQTIARWDMPEDFVVGVNISSLQFFQIGFVDTHANLVQHTVGFLRNGASARYSAKLDVPCFFLYIQLATELGNLAVYRDAAHYRNKPVFLRGVALQIK